MLRKPIQNLSSPRRLLSSYFPLNSKKEKKIKLNLLFLPNYFSRVGNEQGKSRRSFTNAGMTCAVRNINFSRPCNAQFDQFYSSSSTSLMEQNQENVVNKEETLERDEENQNDLRVKVNEIEKGIINVNLSRPSKLNSLDIHMFQALSSTIRDIKGDSSVRAVVLSGSGRAFSSGLDVKSLLMNGENPINNVSKLIEPLLSESTSLPKSPPSGNLVQDVAYGWRSLNVPVIAAIHGVCFGGGLQIALGADMRYVTPDCKISFMEAKWGLVPDMASTITLRELVSIDIAKELTMTGRIISGKEAVSIGLATRCIENGDVFVEAVKMARQCVEMSPSSISACKQMFQETWLDADDQRCLDLETMYQKKLLQSYNTVAAVAKHKFGFGLPYNKNK